jgi:CHAD domain-containing protein
MSELEIANLKNPAKGLEEVLANLAEGIKTDLAALPDDAATRIHDIRVRSKKLWSLSKLARRHSGGEFVRELKIYLRDIKNAFSSSRDEEVMRGHLLKLLPDKLGAKTCEAAGLIASADASESKAPAKTIDSAGKLVHLVESPGWDPLTVHDLCHRFSRSYRSAQKAMAAAEEHFDDELMHDWRKRVKDLFYQATALQSLDPAKELIAPLDDLADTLGQHHDMAVLLARLKEHETSDEAKEIVAKEKHGFERDAEAKGKKALDGAASKLEQELEKAAGE